jgi:mono/diheme cytochrome c family protein
MLAVIAAVLVLSGCTRDQWQRLPGPDEAVKLIPLFATMTKGLAVQPYKWPIPRPPVAGTVPVTGGEAPTPITNRPDDLARINALRNPVQMTALSLERGRERYDIYCTPCHGETGDGQGPVPVGTNLPWVPSLLTPIAGRHSDGMLYAITRHGRGLMPAYGDRLRGEDRWHVVNYVRQLQGAAR